LQIKIKCKSRAIVADFFENKICSSSFLFIGFSIHNFLRAKRKITGVHNCLPIFQDTTVLGTDPWQIMTNLVNTLYSFLPPMAQFKMAGGKKQFIDTSLIFFRNREHFFPLL